VTPVAFCNAVLDELAHESINDRWVRGARALCQMYASVDAQRFETIVERLARDGQGGTALAEGAQWMLARWRAIPRSQAGDTRRARPT
jgi:hypothetical protein